MLDLSQLDIGCQIPQGLRWKWLGRTGMDPLVVTRQQGKNILRWFLSYVGLVFLGLFFVFRYYSWGPQEKQGLEVSVFVCCATGFSCILVAGCSGPTHPEKENALQFAKALERFELDGPFQINTMAHHSYDELVIGAERVLFIYAEHIIDSQRKGEITEAEEYKTKVFAPAHKAMFELGLVEEKWDRFFREQKPVEIPPEERIGQA